MPTKHMPAVLKSTLPVGDGAVLKEIKHADREARERRHQKLLAKMASHRQGNGPAPTYTEFGQWKEDAAFTLVMRRLLADLSVPG